MSEEQQAARAHVQLVEIATDAVFAAAAAAVVGVLAVAAALVLVGGWVSWAAVVVAVPAPLVAAFVSLNGRLGDLRRRQERGQDVV